MRGRFTTLFIVFFWRTSEIIAKKQKNIHGVEGANKQSRAEVLGVSSVRQSLGVPPNQRLAR